MVRSVIVISLLILSLKLFSQSVGGRILDSLGAPVPYSSVGLLNGRDSAVIKGTLTDDTGVFFFESLSPGSYRLKVLIPGFEEAYSQIFRLDTLVLHHVGVIQIKHIKGQNLEEISVSTIKRSVEFKNGNITVNVENSALAAGNSAYDLLTKLPGVAVNEEGISIQGRTGVKVMINGRVQQLSYRQLLNLLRSISGASIEKIEVLKNPPVKYDSEGTAGLINIKIKKVKLQGISGNANFSGSQGFYPGGEASFFLNYKSKRLTFFGDVAGEYSKFHLVNTFNRSITYQSAISEIKQKHLQSEECKEVQGNVGLDLQVSKNNLVGFKITSSPGFGEDLTSGNTLFNDSSLTYNTMPYTNSLQNPWNYSNYNVNAEHAFDSLGSKLIFSADYSPNRDFYASEFDQRFLWNGSDVSAPKQFRTFLSEDVRLLSSKLDLEAKKKETSVQAGIKVSRQQLVRTYVLEDKDPQSETYRPDAYYSNRFIYSEQILAGYVDVEKELDDVELTLGLRAENTSIRMNSPDKNFRRDLAYFNFFPAIGLEYEAGDKHNFELSYNRRINRPDCYAYYPYPIFWNNSLITESGNADLDPEYGNTFELTHVYKSKMTNALAYSRLSNYILGYTLQNDSSKEIRVSLANLRFSETFGYTFFYEGKIRNWWIINGNATLSYLRFKGEINLQPYSSAGFSSNALIRNELITGKRSKLEISAQFVGAQPLGIFTVQPKWGLHIAFKKKFLNQHLDVVIGIDDVFFTMVESNKVAFQNQKWQVRETNDTRRVRLSLSYNFGKIKTERREVNSNDEEKERLKH